MTSYHIWKHELDTDVWHEVEKFTSHDESTDFQCFKNAATRLWDLQYNKQGEWVDKFTFRTDLFVYTLLKGATSKVNEIVSNEQRYNLERFNTLTQNAA